VTAAHTLARALAAGALSAAVLCSAVPALGQPDRPARDSLAASVEQPTGTAEFGFGWLTLPGAEVCVERDPDICREGDSGLALEAWQVFRPHARFAVGAGIMLGLTPTDAPRSDPEGIDRDHTRSYMTVETGGRYYPYVGESFEAYVGLNAGLAVVSDTFTVRGEYPNDHAMVGRRGVTIRTEGFTIGVGGGAAYQFARSWLVGANVRYGSWFFPKKPETNPLGDEASLAGQNSVIVLGLNVAYRVQFY
jgi:hypothetical protein